MYDFIQKMFYFWSWTNDILHDRILKYIEKLKYMDENFQDYSWIQDFEADFPQVSLKMLNLGGHNAPSLIYFQSVYGQLTIILNLKLWIFSGHTARFNIEVSKVKEFGNFELSHMEIYIYLYL